MLLDAVIPAGTTTQQWATANFAIPLGIPDIYRYEGLNGTISAGGGQMVTCRQLLRLGQLIANRGAWVDAAGAAACPGPVARGRRVADPVDPDFPEGMDPRLIAQFKAQQAVWKKLADGIRRPWMTTGLLVIIGIAHLLAGALTFAVGQANLAGIIVASRPTGVLVKLGAMYATEVSGGEKWRLVIKYFFTIQTASPQE